MENIISIFISYFVFKVSPYKLAYHSEIFLNGSDSV